MQCPKGTVLSDCLQNFTLEFGSVWGTQNPSVCASRRSGCIVWFRHHWAHWVPENDFLGLSARGTPYLSSRTVLQGGGRGNSSRAAL